MRGGATLGAQACSVSHGLAMPRTSLSPGCQAASRLHGEAGGEAGSGSSLCLSCLPDHKGSSLAALWLPAHGFSSLSSSWCKGQTIHFTTLPLF